MLFPCPQSRVSLDLALLTEKIVQSSYEYLQGQRFHRLSKQPLSVFSYFHGETKLHMWWQLQHFPLFYQCVSLRFNSILLKAVEDSNRIHPQASPKPFSLSTSTFPMVKSPAHAAASHSPCSSVSISFSYRETRKWALLRMACQKERWHPFAQFAGHSLADRAQCHWPVLLDEHTDDSCSVCSPGPPSLIVQRSFLASRIILGWHHIPVSPLEVA